MEDDRDNVISFPNEDERKVWKLRARRTNKELVMNTKQVTFTNGMKFDIRPLGNKLQAQAAGLLKKRHGVEFTFPTTSMEAALHLKPIICELVVVNAYKKGETTALPPAEATLLFGEYDVLADFIEKEATKFQAELSESWSKDSGN